MEIVKTGSDGVPDELTRRMIDVGAAMLAEHGVDGLSLRKLAAAAGTSTMAVYTRFGGKTELLAAMFREGFRRLGAALEQAAPSVDAEPTLESLAEVGLAYRRAALASPTLYALMFGPLPPGLAPTDEDTAAAQATYDPLREGCRAAVAAGVMVGDPERIALHLWSVAHGMVGLELAGRIGAPTVDARAVDDAPTPDDADATEAEQLYLEALLFSAMPFLPPSV